MSMIIIYGCVCVSNHGTLIHIALAQHICSPSVGYVAHPQGPAGDVKKAIGIIGRFANGAYLTAVSDKDKDHEVGYHVNLKVA